MIVFLPFRYVENGEWDLFRTKVEQFNEKSGSELFSVVRYSITVRRITLYYVMNFILPCVLIAVLTVLVFLLPPESGERVSYGITVILSFTILLLMLYVSFSKENTECPKLIHRCSFVSLTIGEFCTDLNMGNNASCLYLGN